MDNQIFARGSSLPKRIAALTFLALFAACGGDGGDDSDNTEIRGALRSPSGPLPGVTVCALGDCSLTNSEGNYELEIEEDEFAGGNVLFSFNGNGLNTQTAVNLPSTKSDLRVDFAVNGNTVINTGAQVIEDEDDDDFDVDIDDDDDDEDGEIRGNLRTAAGPLPDVTVCALGDCSLTNNNGNFELEPGAFAGGDVLFSFNGNGLNTQTAVNLPSTADEDLHVDFTALGNNVSAVGFRFDNGDDDDDFDIDDDDGDDDDFDVDDDDFDIDGDDEDNTEIRGSVRTAAGPLPGVTVCALGDCSNTNNNGDYEIEIGDDRFAGGPVLFSFNGNGLNTQAVANVPSTSADAEVDFAVSGNTVTQTAGTVSDDDDDDFEL